jgi:hypothetical protein
VHALQGSLSLLHGRSLTEVSVGTPAESQALAAERMSKTSLGAVILGSATLVSGFILGFAADPTQTPVRASEITLGATAIGLGIIYTGTALGARSADNKARVSLNNFAQNCSE